MKTVWILGAGASFSASNHVMPMLNDLPTFAYENGIYRKHADDHEFGLLKDFVQDNVGKSLTRGAKINFEQCMTNLEISYSRTKESKYRTATESLTKLIKEIINFAESGIAASREYEKLRMLVAQDEQNSILSFNWDSLLDQALSHKRNSWDDLLESSTQVYQSFLVNFSTEGAKTIERIGRGGLGKLSKGVYLKLHGSINWYICPTAHCSHHHLIHLSDPDETKLTCGECGACLSSLIVPPTLNKNIDATPLINRIWGMARNEIASAERIIIWGYSLPPTDFYSDWLLRQSSDKLKELVLINPEAKLKKGDGFVLRAEYLNRFEKLANVVSGNSGELYGFEKFEDYQNDRSRLLPSHVTGRISQTLPSVKQG